MAYAKNWRICPCLACHSCGVRVFAGPIRPLTGDILVIGDSVLWWNSEADASVADVLTTRLGLEVANASVPGALFVGPQGDSIQDQYVLGDWAWLVMDGGANDLGEGCGCGDCIAAVDPLISPDATSGAIPAFAQRIVEDGPYAELSRRGTALHELLQHSTTSGSAPPEPQRPCPRSSIV